MILQVVGCSHHNAPIAIRERLAFSAAQVQAALQGLHETFPQMEVVLLSTCNRVELYTAADEAVRPTRQQLVEFLSRFHRFEAIQIDPFLYEHAADEAVRHLFSVAASLDSMVVGEPQILAQVKQAYQLSTEQNTAGPLIHAAFQAASRVARRVANETTIHQRRVSIPSVAVADFALQIFEQLDDKQTLVIGAGEMAEETLQYLLDQGAHDVVVINRHLERAEQLAKRCHGRALPWANLREALAVADLIISTTGAERPIVTLEDYLRIEPARYDRPLFVLDLAVPRDFESAIGQQVGVYLYSIDDLRQTCDRNRRQRDKELPAALRIIDQETERFMAECEHRETSPLIQQLLAGWERPKEEELRRLLNRLPELDEHARHEIRQAFDRLVNKLLHPPLASLRDESRNGKPSALLEALAKLFQLKD
ncbi:MAG: glutamyl-tRNA reductase [Thermoguttaceae bacterium]|jgi:glutamyl-tRNA reductase